MGSNNNSKSVIKFSPKVAVYYFCLFFVPIAVSWLWLANVGVFNLQETGAALLTPVGIIGAVGIIAFTVLWYVTQTKKIKEFNPDDPESIAKTNKTVKRFLSITMYVGILNGFLVPLVVYTAYRTVNLHVDTVTLFTGCVSNVFLFSLLFYILLMQNFERSLTALPFSKEYKSLPLVARSVLVSGLGVCGALLSVITPAISRALKDLPIQQLVLGYLLPAAVIGLIVVVFDSFLQIKGSSKRLKEITDFTDKVANSDYTETDLQVESRDEYGLLINDLNSFHDKTRALLQSLDKSVENSLSTAEYFSSNMTETSSAVEEIMANIDSVKERVVNQSAGVEETSSTIQNMISRINELNQSVDTQVSGVSNSSAAVEEMVANIRSVTQILESNTQNVAILGEESENGRNKINESVSLANQILEKSEGLMEASSIIQSIASQTNLLAMNAAIEAAHAGDAGKGFAVVADEIRKLAEQSNSQGKKISTQLGDLKTIIESVANNTKAVQNQFEVIFNLTNKVQEQETVIKNAMEEQNAGSTQVLQSISEIRSSSDVVKRNADVLLEGGKQIGSEMDILANVTLEINNSMNEMAAGSSQITKAVTASQQISTENHDNITTLKDEMNKFKI